MRAAVRLAVGVRAAAGPGRRSLICTYWLVEGLALGGAVDRAREWFVRSGRYANDLGLLAEGGDPATGARRGNYPQAFSHVGVITAAWRLGQCS